MISREKDSYKGENGKVAVIGGSLDYSGAPALSAQAALRTGADLVNILTSDSVRDVVSGYSENLIVEGYEDKYFGESAVEPAERLAGRADAVVVGPGMSCARQDSVEEFLVNLETPVVIDADAIQSGINAEVSDAIFTPHSGEVELIRKKYGTIEEFIEMRQDTVVLEKGSTDKIYFEDGFEKVTAGHPGLTVGGTGDVLTGIVAGMMAQGLDKKEAAVKAAKVNGKAGEKAAEKYGNGLLATDLIENIPGLL
jgi:NAD(P)H-hydrate epimerase